MGSVKLKNAFPIVWGDLAYQNHWMRKIALAALVVGALSLTGVIALLNRKPLVVMLDAQANVIRPGSQNSIETELEKMAHRYLEFRYIWEVGNQADQLMRAKSFIASQSLKAFEKTAAVLVAFSKGKNVSQRIYPTKILVNSKESKIEVVADRITEIQGLKAATLLRVSLYFQSGPRTAENPWGVYVIKEEEVQ